METYTVHFERDPSGWWIVTVPGVQGCRTQGRSIAEGRRRIREALALFVGETDAGRAVLEDDVALPAPLRRRVGQVMAVRERAELARTEAREATREAMDELTREAGLSLRDAAELLGVSFQRVQQIVRRGKGDARGPAPFRPGETRMTQGRRRHGSRMTGAGKSRRRT